MANEILSADELESLITNVDETGAGKGKREKQISQYDFVRPNKLSGEQLRALQRMHEGIAQNVTMALSTYLRVNLEANIISLGELTFEVFRNSLPSPTVIDVLSMAPFHEHAIATMDMKLAFSLIDRMLGGPGKSLERVRPLTTIESSLIENVIRRFLEQVQAGWKDLVTFTPIVESTEMDPQFVQVIPSSEMVLVATFSLTAPGELEPGEMCFCIPFISLEGVVGQLGSQFSFAAMKREQTTAQRRHLDRVVKHSTLEVRATLGGTTLSVGEVMDLQLGDVLVLDTRADAQLTGQIAGQERLLGRPGRIGKKAGFLIERVLPPGKTVKDRE